jgi:hypothetical protein
MSRGDWPDAIGFLGRMSSDSLPGCGEIAARIPAD